MWAALIAALAFLLGMHVGATWPQFAVWTHLYGRSRGNDMSTSDPHILRLRRWCAALTILFLLSMVGTFVLGVAMIAQRATLGDLRGGQTAYVACQSQYSTAFATAYKARADASIKTTQALDRVIKAVAAKDPVEFDKALTHYLKVRRQQTEDRANNPLPPLPETVCGAAPKD